MLISAVMAVSSCKKIETKIDDASAGAEAIFADMESLNLMYDMLNDIMQNDPLTAQKNGTITTLPISTLISHPDSLFSDGDGIVIQCNMRPIANPLTFEGDLKAEDRALDGSYKVGDFYLKSNAKWTDPGLEVEFGIGQYSPGSLIPKATFVMCRRDVDRTLYKSYWLALEPIVSGQMFLLKRVDEKTLTFRSRSADYIPSDIIITRHIFSSNGNKVVRKMSGKNGPHTEINLTVTQVKGLETAISSDDVFEYSGTIEGSYFKKYLDDDGRKVLSNEKTYYKVNITEPMSTSSDPNCDFEGFVKGKLEFELLGKDVKVKMDFGDGTCDRKVKTTIGKITKEVTL